MTANYDPDAYPPFGSRGAWADTLATIPYVGLSRDQAKALELAVDEAYHHTCEGGIDIDEKDY